MTDEHATDPRMRVIEAATAAVCTFPSHIRKLRYGSGSARCAVTGGRKALRD
jgi:hypothetical protein